MRPGTRFEIELEIPGQASRTVMANSEADALNAVRSSLSAGAEICVACLGDGIDYGNLILFVEGVNQVSLRRLEHRGFATQHPISFQDALLAVEYRLPRQEGTPAIPWVDE